MLYDYLEWKQSHVGKPTLHMYRLWVQRFLSFVKKDINQIELSDVGKFKIHLEKRYSPKNIQYGLTIVRGFLNYCVQVHKLDFPVSMLKIKTERSNSHTPVTEALYQRMLSVLSASEPIPIQRRLMLMLLWDTGIRVGELMDLKIANLKNREAVIENEKNKRSRFISWSEETDVLLQKYLPLRRNLWCKTDHLFVSITYRPCRVLTSRQVERIFETILKKAKIKEWIKPHSFRHGFVHRQLAAGKPITTVAQMLGHSTTVNVLTYAQLSSKEIREAWGK